MLCEEHSAAEPWATGPQESNTTQECQVGPGQVEASSLHGRDYYKQQAQHSSGRRALSHQSQFYKRQVVISEQMGHVKFISVRKNANTLRDSGK